MPEICISIDITGCAGDNLCLISAARTFARHSPTIKVNLKRFPDVIACYGDSLVSCGTTGARLDINPIALHRQKHRSPHLNYLGTYLHLLGLETPEPPRLELPDFPIEGRRVSVIQPYSGTAPNPSNEYIQRVVDQFVQDAGETLYAIGDLRTRRDLKNVDYSLLEDSLPTFLRHIRSAKFVLTPRSAAAHVAAGYRIPAFVWLPDDGENWHLDYPDWTTERHLFTHFPDHAAVQLAKFLKEIFN